MANSWQSPVSGEPSLGTPHATSDANRTTTVLVNTAVNTANVWSASVSIPTAPVGAKAAWCFCYVQLGAAQPILAVEAATGYTLSSLAASGYFKYWHVETWLAGQGNGTMLKIHLDSNKQFKWCTNITNSTVFIMSPIDYDM